ncbi:MAG TPA: hypothetical protein VNC50_16770 [Planctomycetia bacterium]|nr:hypothetical protein [Planctomycetia bacterium]
MVEADRSAGGDGSVAEGETTTQEKIKVSPVQKIANKITITILKVASISAEGEWLDKHGGTFSVAFAAAFSLMLTGGLCYVVWRFLQ